MNLTPFCSTSINANGGFKRLEHEDDYEVFLRWVATSLFYEESEKLSAVSITKEELESYLSQLPKAIVLLVDELNARSRN